MKSGLASSGYCVLLVVSVFTMSCASGTGGTGLETEAVCNGIDDDGDGETDEDVEGIGGECAVGVGGCERKGKMVCDGESGELVCSVEAGAPVDELCNGLDDDCDGEIDEDFTTLGSECSEGVGKCAAVGKLVCDEKGGLRCNAEPGQPVDELCNGLDDNCNGEVDETFAELGDSCEKGTGACVASGKLVCSTDGASTVCDAYPGEPSAELCNAVDDNCDGETDEAFPDLGEDCTVGQGACQATGKVVCAATGFNTVCDAVPGAPVEELCNGIDDDCNGVVDETFKTLGIPCTAGEGPCENEGELICSEDGKSVVCSAVAGDGGEELCDGFDNDCDEEVDETFTQLGQTCSVTQGGCTSTGVYVCASDKISVTCDAPPFIQFPELCNGIDDDCDGEIDEAFPTLGQTCQAGAGACKAEGVFVCAANGYGVECNAVAGTPIAELCNGIDDDCDGLVDEGFPLLGIPCEDGTGLCKDKGVYICSDDQTDVKCSVKAGDPNAEICDGLDNDCDGLIDEKDSDGDGYIDVACGGLDCDDNEPTAHPGGIEVCTNGIDEDCSGAADDIDLDGDGSIAASCGGPDCNDANKDIGPTMPELCDGIDNNCDGKIDELFAGLGDPCTVGKGECTANGTIVCSLDKSKAECSAKPGVPVPELCDGKDNDCDGAVDEGFEIVGSECVVGKGECKAVGQYQCSKDGFSAVCSVAAGQPSTEICDGKDNDCDGDVDEGFIGLGQACSVGVGECQVSGVNICATNGKSVVCDAVEGQPVAESCNGKDDDCNGKIDDKDADKDGFIDVACGGTDCDDTKSAVKPGAKEICGDNIDNDCSGKVDDLDLDKDGYVGPDCGGDDCNDNNPNINPGALELCDGIDNNCNGKIDDKDLDKDGYIDVACGGKDCNDNNAKINPKAVEICNGLDDDCNGLKDDKDADGDGSWDEQCGGADCDDENPMIHPLAVDICDGIDNNCDGVTDPIWDADFDGHWGIACGGKDCNDGDPSIYPGAPDFCDGIDSNCDGDKEPDADGDGWRACAGDCNDKDKTIFPGAVEVCGDGIDQDCSGDDDDRDADLDGYVDAKCGGDDCNDSDPKINPGAPERCNNIDDNCDGDVDEWVDMDGDGFMDADCGGDDCDDKHPNAYPGAPEYCDGYDNNCDGKVDEVKDGDGDGYPGIACGGKDCDDTKSWVNPAQPLDWCDGVDANCDGKSEKDEDGDGYLACEECNDKDPKIFPGAEEVCDGVDNDCDGIVDNRDMDGDGWITWECGGKDCDDNNPNRHPGMVDICNGVDDNCDGIQDENADADGDGFKGIYCGGTDCDDGDPATNPGQWDALCDGWDQDCDGFIESDFDGDGFWTCTGDCNDNDPKVRPGAVDFCDGIDNNCDGIKDPVADYDGDGHKGKACGGDDCNDNDKAMFPGNPEICDLKDNDCNGVVDDNIDNDYDDDGYVRIECGGDDCDDYKDWVHPGADEICANGIDDDCDGNIDGYMTFDEPGSTNDWVKTGGWGIYSAAPQSWECPTMPFPSKAWGTDGNRVPPYPGNDNENSWAQSSPVTIPAFLQFKSWHVDEGGDCCDSKVIRISVDNGNSWTTLLSCRDGINRDLPMCQFYWQCRSGTNWDNIKIPTGNLGGKVGILRFEYTTLDSCCSMEQGWFMDDMNVGGAGACVFVNPTCGNKKIESGEECDDGNKNAGDGCGPTCKIESNKSCLKLLEANPQLQSGTHEIDPDGPAGPQQPLNVYCDMQTDGGGYTMVKFSPGLGWDQNEYFNYCKSKGLELIVPRTQAHAFKIRDWNNGVIPNIVNVFPKYPGAYGLNEWTGKCQGSPCSFWLSSSNNAAPCWGFEPNGDNDPNYALYRWGDGCEYGGWNDGYNSMEITGWVICSTNDK